MWGNGGPERRNEVVPAFMTEFLLGNLEEAAQSFEDLAYLTSDSDNPQPRWNGPRDACCPRSLCGKKTGRKTTVMSRWQGSHRDPGLLEGKCSGHQTWTWLACREPRLGGGTGKDGRW